VARAEDRIAAVGVPPRVEGRVPLPLVDSWKEAAEAGQAWREREHDAVGDDDLHAERTRLQRTAAAHVEGI
jgi:hypothetical protein